LPFMMNFLMNYLLEMVMVAGQTKQIKSTSMSFFDSLVCNSHSNKETELFAEPLNGHGAFFDDFPLVLSAKTEY